MQNKYNFVAKPRTSKERLNEVGSLVVVAIRRLLIRESQKNGKTGDFLLDSNR